MRFTGDNIWQSWRRRSQRAGHQGPLSRSRLSLRNRPRAQTQRNHHQRLPSQSPSRLLIPTSSTSLNLSSRTRRPWRYSRSNSRSPNPRHRCRWACPHGVQRRSNRSNYPRSKQASSPSQQDSQPLFLSNNRPSRHSLQPNRSLNRYSQPSPAPASEDFLPSRSSMLAFNPALFRQSHKTPLSRSRTPRRPPSKGSRRHNKPPTPSASRCS